MPTSGRGSGTSYLTMSVYIFAFGEELRQLTQKNVDAFEIREINKNTLFYDNIMREGVRIA